MVVVPRSITVMGEKMHRPRPDTIMPEKCVRYLLPLCVVGDGAVGGIGHGPEQVPVAGSYYRSRHV